MDGRSLKNGWVIAAALIGWVVVAVVGAGERVDSEYWLGTKYLSDIFSGVMTAVMILGVAALALMSGRSDGETQGPAKRRTGIWGFVLVGLIVLIWQPDIALPDTRGGTPGLTESIGDGEADDDPAITDERQPVAELSDLILLGAGVGALAVVVALSRRRTAPFQSSEQLPFDEPDTEPDATEFAHAVDRAVGQLQTGEDTRAAVIAAYAELEAALSTHGQRRLVAETVNEHLTRAMAALEVRSEPFERLGRLYEVARFSTDTISADDQQAAAASLDRARDELLANV